MATSRASWPSSRRRASTPDIVVANAGFGVVGNAQNLTLDDYRRQFETNVFGVLRTFHETLDALRATRGRFVIMGSVAGHLSGPGSSPYTMSKFAVRALAEALHGDLRAAGVGCTLISPGLRRLGHPPRRQPRRLARGGERPGPRMAAHEDADKAARVMVRGILRGPARGRSSRCTRKVIVFMARHFPRFTRWVLLRANRGSRPEPKRR